jgi:hypothetical protein
VGFFPSSLLTSGRCITHNSRPWCTVCEAMLGGWGGGGGGGGVKLGCRCSLSTQLCGGTGSRGWKQWEANLSALTTAYPRLCPVSGSAFCGMDAAAASPCNLPNHVRLLALVDAWLMRRCCVSVGSQPLGHPHVFWWSFLSFCVAFRSSSARLVCCLLVVVACAVLQQIMGKGCTLCRFFLGVFAVVAVCGAIAATVKLRKTVWGCSDSSSCTSCTMMGCYWFEGSKKVRTVVASRVSQSSGACAGHPASCCVP